MGENKRMIRGETQRGRTGASGIRRKNISFSALKSSFCFRDEIHHVFLIHTSNKGGEEEKLDRRKASAGGKVNGLSLLYWSHFIHLVGLIKCQVEFLDI